jgi:kynurenine formamidase
MTNNSSQLIDVSHTVENGLVTYKGLPAPVISDFVSREASREHYEAGAEFHIGKIEMVANTGTYVDAPSHRYFQGNDLAELPLASIANLDGLVFRPLLRQRAVNASTFKNAALAGKAILIQTGWSKHWNTDRYFEGHPFLTEYAAQYLADEGAALVGIDSLNIDDTSDGRRPAHSILLGADIPIVEHLTHLDRLPNSGFRFFAVPVKVKSLGSFPVRAYAIVD